MVRRPGCWITAGILALGGAAYAAPADQCASWQMELAEADTKPSEPAAPAPAATSPPPPPAPPPTAPPASASGPADAEARAGLDALQGGDLGAARTHFEKALALDANHQFSRSRLAYIKFRKGDYAGAAADAEKAVSLDRADSLSNVILGRSREASGNPAGALTAYTAAIDAGTAPTTSEGVLATAIAYYLRAMLRLEAGQTTDVESDLRETLRTYPKNGYAQYELGVFLVRAKRPSEAAAELLRAKELLPSFQPQESWVYQKRRYLFVQDNVVYWYAAALRESGKPQEALAEITPLLSKVESLAGSTLTSQGGAAAAALSGKVETSFYAAHYEAALACEAIKDPRRGQGYLKTLQRLGLADAETQRLARDLQKRLK